MGIWANSNRLNDKLLTAKLKEIGFANNVTHGPHDFHVQTEIIIIDEIKVRTTIHLHGTVVDAQVLIVDESGGGLVDRVSKAAMTQHNNAVEKVTAGAYG